MIWLSIPLGSVKGWHSSLLINGLSVPLCSVLFANHFTKYYLMVIGWHSTLLMVLLGIPLCSTGPRSAVGNVSGYRCVSDCRSRGREFDPGPVPYFRGD